MSNVTTKKTDILCPLCKIMTLSKFVRKDSSQVGNLLICRRCTKSFYYECNSLFKNKELYVVESLRETESEVVHVINEQLVTS